MQNKKTMIFFKEKFLQIVFVMISCLLCSHVTLAAESKVPQMFSAGANKTTSSNKIQAVSTPAQKTLSVSNLNEAQKIKEAAAPKVISISGIKSIAAPMAQKNVSSAAEKTQAVSNEIKEISQINSPKELFVSDSKKVSSDAKKTLSSPVSSLFSSGEVEMDTNMQGSSDEKETSNFGFELSTAPEYEGAVTFEADEEQLSALPLMKGLYELSSEAQNMHNTKQQLPSMRKPFFEYEKMKNRHAKAVERLARSVTAARDYLANYYGTEKANDLWFGKGCHYRETILGQKCAQITGCKKPYDPTKYTPVTSYNIVCQDDVFSLTDYPKMRGLLGQSISAYKVAKAEAATGLELTDENFEEVAKAEFGTPVVDTNLSSLGSDDGGSEQNGGEKSMNFLQSGKELSADDLSVLGGGIEENPEKSAESEASMREQNLVRWQIGSSVAQKIGQDMAAGGQNYGVPNTVYPLWEDEKRVYNQYLREKYKNMELYFSSSYFNLIDFDVAKALNETLKVSEDYIETYRVSLVAQLLDASEIKKKVDEFRAKLEEEKEALKNQNSKDIELAKNKFEQSLNKISSISELKTKQENEMRALEEKAVADEKSAKSALQQKYNEIDEILTRLNKTKDEYQKKLEEQEDAKSMANAQDRSVELEEKKIKKDPNYVSGFKDDAISTKIKNLQIVVELQPEIDALKKQIDADQEKVKKLKAEVTLMSVSTGLIKKAYIKNAVLMESRHHKEMKEALEARGKDGVLPQVFMATILGTVNGSVQSMLGVATDLRTSFQERAQAEVAQAYQDISSLENLYQPQTYPKILARHQKMLENIKKLKREIALQSLGKFVFGNVVFGFSGLPIFECSDCENEDEEYYVGFEGTKRDFFAPKHIAQSYTPPLREVIHFDAVDLDNINKYEPENGSNPKTTQSEFLKLGQKLTNIWTRILMPRGFVERDIDIEDILMDGEEATCGNGLIPVCSSSNAENSSRAFLEAKGEVYVPNVGELSVIFKYDNGLTFTDALMELNDESENAEDNFTGGDNPSEEEINEYTYLIQDLEKRFLARTQIGDVLQFMDMEQTYQKSLDQLKVNIDETRRTIDEFVEKLDCSFVKKDTDYLRPGEENSRIVSSEFLADDETFEAVSQCLDTGKNKFIQAALDLQKELPVINEELMGYKEKSDNMIMCMQKDNDELVVLADNTSPSTELDEQIKSERVNGEVSGKYREEGNKQMKKDQLIPSPYKANFGPGDPYVP